MERELFLRVKELLENFKYRSMNYTAFEEVSEYKLLCENEKVILLYGYNVESKFYEYHWASNKVKDLLSVLDSKSENVLITFVPSKWVRILKQVGYHVFTVWNEYNNSDISNIEYSDLPEYLVESECEAASQVTLSCCGQSRGFTGQTTEWMEQWINGVEPASLETGAKNCVVLIHRYNGQIVGVICTATYDHLSEKGAIAWVREVTVHPSFQKQGIAKKLIMQALNYGKMHGATRAFLMADECNEHAIHLYEKLGFQANDGEMQIDMVK